MHWIRTAYLFLVRSGRSTLVLSLMVVAAVASLIFLSAFAVGVNDAMIRNSTGLFSGQITATDLPPTLSPKALQIEGTTAVLKRIRVPGTLIAGNRFETVQMVGLNPAAERRATALHRKIIKGKGLNAGAREILLSSDVASHLAVSRGDVVVFRASRTKKTIELRVSGIYNTGMPSLDRGIAFCPAGILPVEPEQWSAAVFLRQGVSPEAIVRSYHNRLGPIADRFATWKDFMPDLVQLIQLNYISMSIVMILVFSVVSVGIACAFVVFIFRSLREYGILKAMGVTSWEVAFVIAAEVVLINLAACFAGVLIGAGAAAICSHIGIDLTRWTTHNQYFAVSGDIFPRLTVYSLVVPPVLALGFGLLSSVWPALLVARKRAVDILNLSP